MATVINNPGASPTVERTIERESDSGAGWAVAVIILLAVVAIGGFVWMQYYRAPAAAPTDGGTNINVSLPEVPAATPGAGAGAGAGSSGNTGAGSGAGGSAQPTE